MPPQPGMFPLHSHKPPRGGNDHLQYGIAGGDGHYAVAGPSSGRLGVTNEEPNLKDRRKRKEMVGKVGKEMSDRRDDGRHYTETLTNLHTTSLSLSTHPGTVPSYTLRLYPLSLERSALLGQNALEEKFALEGVEVGWKEEREKVEEEWRRGRERIRERMLEGVEERRRRAREEKDGEGIGDANLDSQSRPHITRKLRNKLGTGTSPPPTPLSNTGHPLPPTNPLPSLTTPLLNPHSLSIDELPSPFPLPLTLTLPSTLPASSTHNAGATSGSRRRAKGGAGGAGGKGGDKEVIGGLGKSLVVLGLAKESEIEGDLGDIRRGSKRRRAAGVALGKA
ncbi:hypothetical protein JAAARDRAFT_211532 [Jaapia argillacea MUCL 33604]|uniref:Uncharacterized protein n=1 Tax=Jaapia argillacea MUCL 33604 TaxID=933084 RepID=A0A067PI44_9AGAM|nr:hypothetical protein JAAARDRAFT_211532 [Jaapia argillacea MUCL 33604]